MKTIVILDSSNQDLELGIEIHRIMLERGWQNCDDFSFAYVKDGKGATVTEIKTDVGDSVFQAEWKNVKYLYQIGSSELKFGIA